MIEYKQKYSILTEEIEDNLKVTFLDKKTCDILFECSFKVYANYDLQGLIEDAIGIYNRFNYN